MSKQTASKAKPTAAKPLVVVIKNSEWGRGASTNAKLFSSDSGLMCCLGIDGRACGIPLDAMVDHGLPSQIFGRGAATKYRQVWARRLNDRRLEDCASAINDDNSINDIERLKQLRPIFRAAGRKIVWRPDL